MYKYAIVEDDICICLIETGTMQLGQDKIQIGETDEVVLGSTLSDGVWTAPVVSPVLTVNMSIAGGDGLTPPGITNNGVDFVLVKISVTMLDGTPAPMPDANYRITIRDSANAEYDVISIPFVGGAASFNYRSDMRPATVRIDVNDLSIPGVDVGFQIIGDNLIKIYRNL
jgi:hypothetical protein